MNWLTNFVKPKLSSLVNRRSVPEKLWNNCVACGNMIHHKDLKENLYVCINCNYHFRMSAENRIKMFFEDGDYSEITPDKISDDPLKFIDKKKYKDRLKEYRKKTKRDDAFILLKGKIKDKEIISGLMNFEFMGGSMGRAVGGAIVKGAKIAIDKKLPYVVVTSSGGARMQEGILSLMQMPRTVAAIQIFKETKLPYIVLFTNPVTGGVSASFTMLGDILIAEPGALIGFAGPRVIKKTVNQELPEGFQKSEYLLENGMIDLILNRNEFKNRITKILKHLMD